MPTIDPNQPGLYELLVTEALLGEIDSIEPDLVVREQLNGSDVSDRIALHVSQQIVRAIESVEESKRADFGARLANRVIKTISQELGNDSLSSEQSLVPAQVFEGIKRKMPDGTAKRISPPTTSLLETTLLTNSPGEPGIGGQIASELNSCSSVDVVMAFITWGGIQNLRRDLEAFLISGKRLRILTSTFTGTTDQRSLNWLQENGAEVRVSYSTDTTRLHAKAWLFERANGFSTAFVGSANLTYTALSPGREWNVRISESRNPDIVDRIRAVFETYWENPDFRPYDPAEFEERQKKQSPEKPHILVSPVAVRPLPFQERLLEQLDVSRGQGHHRNLLVAATGTGKTVMAALDYARLALKLPRNRLLFIAHRVEILEQSQATFCQVLQNHNFGEQWVQGRRPNEFEHVFASVQSLRNNDLRSLDRKHFDVVIIDEFHHAAAASYQTILEHLEPIELLGLTATPERTDGLPVLKWFDDRIAAELRLWDAIDQQYLSPFWYFGIHDGVDLSQVPWRRGLGYDNEQLAGIYTANDIWANFVLKEFLDRVDDLPNVKALGFCVNVDHARFMARVFNEAGVKAKAIWANTPAEERRQALRELERGEIWVVFSVDLFNEGIDVPAVNTLLFLRPTQSATLFLQQLGRGLRSSPQKPYCLVLDFVGQHRNEFRFDLPLRALLGGSRKDVIEQVERGFPYLPSGCSFNLDEKSSRVILNSLKNAIPSTWAQKVRELNSLQNADRLTLSKFLDQSGLDLVDVYPSGSKGGWTQLREAAGLSILPAGRAETKLRRGVGRLLHVNDPERQNAFRDLFRAALDRRPLTNGSKLDIRMRRMLLAPLIDQVGIEHLPAEATIDDAYALLSAHPQVCSEGIELMDVLAGKVDHVFHAVEDRPDLPLRIHGTYSRIEILAAFADGAEVRTSTWREGVRSIDNESVDLLAVTLDKSTGNFSPRNRYRDYAISQSLFHWESQSTTRADSPTGRRYQNHLRLNRDIMLFARLRQDDRAFWFLGPATYQSHKGEMPMAITWKLNFPLPGDLFSQFTVAAA
jgi:superfamily II DNA or RNA helicase